MKFIESLIPAHLATAIGETLMHSLWELTAVAIFLLLALQVLRKDASRLRYGLGLFALAAMVALPIATFVAVYQPAAPAAAVELTQAVTAAPAAFNFEQAASAAPMGVLAQVNAFFEANAYLILLVWGLGTFLFTLRLGRNYLKVRRLRRDHTLPVPEKVLDVLCQLRDRMGVRQAVRFLQSTAIDSPMVMGALKPVILVPAGLFTGMDPQQVECIIAHELAHIRRYDYVVNLMQSVVEVVLFFHPAVWWASQLVREERENCCDQVVVDLKSDRMVYAKALLNLEVMRSRRPELAMASTGGKLFKRIQRITGKPEGNRKHHSRGIFLALVTMGAFVILLGTGNRETKASAPLAAIPIQVDGEQQPDGFQEVQAKMKKAVVEASALKNKLKERLIDRELAWGDKRVKAQTVAFEDDQPEFAIVQMTVDSPFTKVILNEDGEEVTVFLDDNGDVVGVTKGGANLPASEFGYYEEQVAASLKRFMYAQTPPPPPAPPVYKGKTPPAGIPVPPALPSVKRAMPTPPALPNMKNMPPIPVRKDGESDRAFERRMDNYEEEVEEWAEKFEEEFENGDWEAFENDMEAWGEELAAAFEGQDWSQFENDMEAWGESFAESFDEGEWEEFGEKMEAWGEEFGAQWENWGENFGEKFGAEMEEWGEEFGEEMAKAFGGMGDHDFTSGYTSGIEELQGELERDGLVKNNGSFKLKINEDTMYVNGEKQSRSTRDRYAELLHRHLGLEAQGEDFVEINRKKSSLQIEQ